MKVQVLGDGAFQDKMLAWRVRPPRQWDLDNQSASFGWIYEIKPVFICFSRQAKLWGAWTWTVLEIIGNYFRYLSVDNGENWCSVTAAPAPWLGPVSETMQHVMIVIFSSQFNSFYSECESHLFYFPLSPLKPGRCCQKNWNANTACNQHKRVYSIGNDCVLYINPLSRISQYPRRDAGRIFS